MEIPIYFSQTLIIVSKIISNRHFSDTILCNPVTLNNDLMSDNCDSYFDQYFSYPYNYTCWYLTSYKMIFQNRLYYLSYSCRRLLMKLCVNLINKLTFLCRNLTMINIQ